MAATSHIDDVVEFLESGDVRVRTEALKVLASLCPPHADDNSTHVKKTEAPGFMLKSALRVDRKVPDAVQAALTALINLSGDDSLFIQQLIKRGWELGIPVVTDLLAALGDSQVLFPDLHAMLLVNLTRDSAGTKSFLQMDEESGLTRAAAYGPKYNVGKLVDALVFAEDKGGAVARAVQQWTGPILENVTQVKEARLVIMRPDSGILELLLPLLRDSSVSISVRRGVAGVLNNCAFERESHPQLLGLEGYDDPNKDNSTYPGSIVPYLLWPLRDATVLRDAENALVDISLRNERVGAKKEIEKDAELRKRCLNALLLLTNSRTGRDALRRQGVYPVLRVYDLKEDVETLKAAIEEIVDLVMLAEEEDGSVGGTPKFATTVEHAQPQTRQQDSRVEELPSLENDAKPTETKTPAPAPEPERMPQRVPSEEIEEI